jgi:hypothetical protein
MKSWQYGDWVRVVHHPDRRAVGWVFQIDRFSSMDGLSDHPVISNPFRKGLGAWRGRHLEPMLLRFHPDGLEEASVLDRLSQV